jgi:hypothetical protein
MAAELKVASFASILLLILAVTVTACEDQDVEDQPSPSVAPASETTGGDNPASPGEGQVDYMGDSLRHIVEWHSNAVVGRFLEPKGVYHLDPAVPYTMYSFEVTDVIGGDDLAVGDTPTVAVYGGPTPSGEVVPIVNEPVTGGSYLVFLADMNPIGLPAFSGEALARFRLSGDGHVVPNGFEYLVGVRVISGISEDQYRSAADSPDPAAALSQIKGQTLGDAAKAVAAAFAEAPLPTPPWLSRVSVPSQPTPIPSSAPSHAPTSPTPILVPSPPSDDAPASPSP